MVVKVDHYREKVHWKYISIYSEGGLMPLAPGSPVQRSAGGFEGGALIDTVYHSHEAVDLALAGADKDLGLFLSYRDSIGRS